jgi:hypothetical protein
MEEEQAEPVNGKNGYYRFGRIAAFSAPIAAGRVLSFLAFVNSSRKEGQ